MPTVFRFGSLIVTINPKDKHRFPHVHVYKGHPKRADASALIRIDIWVVLEHEGFSERALNEIVTELKRRHSKLMEKWREYNEG